MGGKKKNEEPSPVTDTPGSSSCLYHRYAAIAPIVKANVFPWKEPA